MAMENEKSDDRHLTTREWVCRCLGLVLIGLSIIGASAETALGQFLAYSLSYLFGFFYPFVLAFVAVLGVRLTASKKAFPIQGKGRFWIGLVLLFVAVLAFGSFSFIVEKNDLGLTDVGEIYSDRILSFARYPFKIDNFASLGGLGGGFLGLFLVALFGGLWSRIGDAIFFSLLLLLGLFFICYQPLKNLWKAHKDRQAQKVHYTSPFQAKDNTQPQPNVSSTSNSGTYTANHGPYTSLREPRPEAVPVTPAVTPIPVSSSTEKITYAQGGFTSASRPLPETPAPQLESHPAYAAPQTPIVTPTPTAPEPTPSSSAQGSFRMRSYPQASEPSPAQPQPTIAPTPSQAPMSESPLDDLLRENPQTASQGSFRSVSVASSQPVPAAPVVMPAPATPVNENPQPAEFAVESAETPNPQQDAKANDASGDDKDDKDEPDQAALEEKYFAYKASQQRAHQAVADQAKQAEMAKIIQFVSDKPRVYSYPLPTDSLLSAKDDSDKIETNRKAAQEKAQVINKVFDEFGFQAKAVSFIIGASVTRFNIQTDPGVKADRIEGYLSDVQRALNGDQSVRIQAVVEGQSTSGIEVGNASPMTVPFKDVFQRIEMDNKENLLIPIGKDIIGNIITYPLNEMPHLLVAGTTGSGKSVLVNCMIMTLIMRNYPNQLKLMLIDPKQVEFAKYNMEPHLFCPVIQDSKSALTAMKKLCDEMDRRYALLRTWNCVKISEYRAKRQGREDSMDELPDIVVVIDEFADLMNTTGDEIADYVQRITQKSRAAGIYMIIATQRPSKEAIPMAIKGNIACRIGLCCSSQVDSRVILDENGCEALLGRGDLLFKCPGKKSLIRAQSPFISNQDMDNVLTYLKQMGGDPNYNPTFLDLKVKEEEPDAGQGKSSDDLYQDVKDYVMITGICSRSALMRNFSLSYSKVDQMILSLRNEGVIQAIQGGKNIVVMRKNVEA